MYIIRHKSIVERDWGGANAVFLFQHVAVALLRERGWGGAGHAILLGARAAARRTPALRTRRTAGRGPAARGGGHTVHLGACSTPALPTRRGGTGAGIP